MLERRRWLVVGGVAAVVVVACLGLTVGIGHAIYYKHSDSPSIRWLSRVLPIPAARVGRTSVLYRDYLKQHDALKHFLASPAAKAQQLNLALNADLEKNILEKLVAQQVLEQAASDRRVTVTDDDVRQSFTQVVAMASSTTPDVGVYLWDNFGWNEEDFRQSVVRPALLEEKLTKIMSNENQGDPGVLSAYMDKQLASKEVVRYLRF